MSNRFFELVCERTVIFDGAMGTEIQSLESNAADPGPERENCPEQLNLTRPGVIEGIHRRYLEAGADVIETNTFGANVLVLKEFGLEEACRRINREAAWIARRAIEAVGATVVRRFVAGAIGPGTKLPSLGQVEWSQMRESYREQVRGLLEGGVDVLIIETVQDLLQAKCALHACLDALEERGLKPVDGRGGGDVPIMVQMTVERSGTMLPGTSLAAAVTALEGYPVFSLGLNCGTGPGEMREHLRWLSRRWERFISVQPNAGLPSLVEGRAVYPLGAEAFGQIMGEFVRELGVEIVGGCCGTGPEHIRQLVARIRPEQGSKRLGASEWGAEAKQSDLEGTGIRRKVEPRPRACSSLFEAVEYRQETSILSIGERMNASGSKAFRQMLEKEDWEAMVSLARQQVREGSHVLDVNVDMAERDGARDMRELIPRLVRQVNAPLMIDSSRLETIEAGLQCAGGKCIINSANLEEGEESFRGMVRLAQRYGAALVIGAIDDDPQEPMARTAERKLAVIRRMHGLAVREMGFDERDLFIDPLVLPVGTGMQKDRRSALETIEAVRQTSQEFPACQTVVGLSNVSFGLKPEARVALNSVFLHELIQAGLTAAILHVSRILPRNRIDDERWEAALDVIYDRWEKGDPLQRFIAMFEGKEEEKEATVVGERRGKGVELTVEERLRRHIVDGEMEGLAATLEEALKKYGPLEIINEHLLEGMRVVGEMFGAGKMQLPFVLQSAEVMKAAVGRLEGYMDKTKEAGRKGTIVLATVKGDVHDIGKNLVDIILRNNGYTVHNLGIKQPLWTILEKWRETKANAIGLSGLLVKSVQVMREYLEELNELEERPVVLVGGAALSRHYAEGELRRAYRGRLYYGQDAFEGLRIMDQLVSGRAEALEEEIRERLAKRAKVEEKVGAGRARVEAAGDTGARQEPAGGVEAVPRPPFWGSKVVEDIDAGEVYRFVNKAALYQGQWQYRKGRASEEEYRRRVEEEVEPIFQRLCRLCREEKILRPKVVYGYFPANSRGDELVVFDPGDPGRELARFRFPRQRGGERRCLSDYFLLEGSGRRDVVAMQCVTVGEEIGKRARGCFERDEYREYLHWHGFAVECAEALAELWHRRIREELGIAAKDGATVEEIIKGKYQGKRYSLGYPACPDLRDQEKIFALLKPERIGCRLTENWQIEPEESTSAIIVHQAGAKYFSV